MASSRQRSPRSHELCPRAPRRGDRRSDRGARPVHRLRVDLDGRRRQGGLPERRLHLRSGGGQPGSAVGHRRDLPGPVPGAVDADLGQQLAEPDRLAQRPDDHQAADDQGRRGQQGDDPARAGARADARRHRAVPARRRRQRRHGLAPVARRVRRQRELPRPLRRDDRVARRRRRGGRRLLQHLRPDRQQRHRHDQADGRLRLRPRDDQLAAGRRGRRSPSGHDREEPRDDRRRAVRRRARHRRRRHDDRALGHRRLRQPGRLTHPGPGHVHLRPARNDHRQRAHRRADAHGRRARP